MTREEAIAILEDEAYVLYEDDSPYNRQAFDVAIEALQEQKTGKWIPCSERLPEENQMVLITNNKGHVRCGQYRCLAFRDKDPRKWWWKNKTIETVIAWMPLPKPYQEE